LSYSYLNENWGQVISAQALEDTATGVGISKAAIDFGIYAYGFVQCR
jgi:hypothetical protein